LRRHLSLIMIVVLIAFSMIIVEPATAPVDQKLIIQRFADAEGNIRGSVNLTDGLHTYAYGTVVAVKATPDTGYGLDRWELNGINVGRSRTYVVTMTNNHTLAAFFMPVLYIGATPGGSTTPAAGSYYRANGTSQSVTAAPVSGAWFDHWELDGSNVGSSSPYSVTMGTASVGVNHNLTAVFKYNVTIAAYCYIQDAAQSVSIQMDGSPTGHNTPYKFTALLGEHRFSVPATDTHGHPFLRWNTGIKERTITGSPGATHTAYYWQAGGSPRIFVNPTNVGGDGTPAPGSWTSVKVNVSSTPDPGLWDYGYRIGLDPAVFPPMSPLSNMNFTDTGSTAWTTSETASYPPYWKSPTSNTGQWTTPTEAYSSNDVYASASTAGYTHTYGTYGFNLPGDAVITKVELGHEAYVSSASWKMNVTVTWNNEASWATEQKVSLTTGDPGMATAIDITGVTSWDSSKLSNANFKVRVKAVRDVPIAGWVRIDWLPVRVTYSAPRTPDNGYDIADGNTGGSGSPSYYHRVYSTADSAITVNFATEQQFTYTGKAPAAAYLTFAYKVSGNSFGPGSVIYIIVIKPDGSPQPLETGISVTGSASWTYRSGSTTASVFDQTGLYRFQFRSNLTTATSGTGNYIKVNWDDVGLVLAPVSITFGSTLRTGGTTFPTYQYSLSGTLSVWESLTGAGAMPVPGNYSLATIWLRVGYGHTTINLYDTKLDTLDLNKNPVEYFPSVEDGDFDNRLYGDLNSDRTVNSADLTIMKLAYGSTSSVADINKDGIVDAKDLRLLGKNYGRSV